MSDQILNSHRLATLSEFRYILLEVLDRKDPIPWYDLSFSCKELSLNFAFSFENSISFLQLISLINVHINRSVSRVEEDYKAIDSEHDFSIFILRRTLAYLENNKLLEKVFNKNTILADPTSDVVVIRSREFPPEFLFIQSLLLNLGVVVSDENENGKLYVTADYKSFFKEELLTRIFGDPTLRNGSESIPTMPGKIPTFFISYAYKDMEFKNELQNHLSGLKRMQLIKDWEGRAILPGEEWEEEIRQKLEQAEVVLFLVSSDFLASDYIHDVEIKKTFERYAQGKVRIIPIIVRPCDFKSLAINRYQALPDGAKAISLWPNRDEAYLNIVNRIREVIKQLN